MPRVKINIHESYHDCETCGGSSTTIYTVRGALGQFSSGDEAYCFGVVDGELWSVVDFIMNALKERGHTLDLPDFEEHIRLNSTIDWEAYHNGIESGIYDWEEKVPEDVRKYNLLEREIEHFYHTNWKIELTKCGYELKLTRTMDDDSWYEDDY